MGFDWYPLNPIDWKRDTLHLSLAEEGAYRRLTDEYMINGGPLPDNDAAIARLIGVSLEEWLAVALTVRKFYETSNGKLVHKRCEQEINTARIRGALRSEVASKAVNARWAKHRETQEIIRRVYAENSGGLRKHTTLHNNTLLLPSEPRDADKNGPPGGDKNGPTVLAAKRPSEVTRQELDAVLAARRSPST